NNLRHPKRDMIWVAAAGPATNLVLAFVWTIVWKWLAPMVTGQAESLGSSGTGDYLRAVVLMAQTGILINVVLAVVNALPLPLLDGGRVMVGLLPRVLSVKLAKVEPFGFMILIVLLM